MNVYSLLEVHVVSQMTPVIELTQIDVVSAGTYKLYSCNTEWVSPGDTITIDGEDYFVESFVINEYLIVTGTTEPTQLYFQLSAPHFEYGNHRKVENERSKVTQKTTITPLIYVMPARNNRTKDYDTPYGFDGDLRVFGLGTFNQRKDDIDTHQDEVIEPMRAMMRYFVEKYNEREDLFEQITDCQEFDWMDFGNPQIWGNNPRIFSENLSGVENTFRCKAFETDDCCESIPAVSCLPAKILINGTHEDDAPSGQNFPLIVRDTNGATPVITYDESTKKITVPATQAASIDVTINDAPFLTDQSANVNIDVLNTADTPVGTTEPGNIVRIDDVTIDNSDVSYTQDIAAEGAFILPDTQFNITLDGVAAGSGSFPTLTPTVTINITLQ
jgi:hypothetical protein